MWDLQIAWARTACCTAMWCSSKLSLFWSYSVTTVTYRFYSQYSIIKFVLSVIFWVSNSGQYACNLRFIAYLLSAVSAIIFRGGSSNTLCKPREHSHASVLILYVEFSSLETFCKRNLCTWYLGISYWNKSKQLELLLG